MPSRTLKGAARSALAMLALFLPLRASFAQSSNAPVQHVIVVSVDGLHSQAVSILGEAELPTFFRLRAEGAHTDRARTDVDFRNTLPNHVSMVTGRPVLGDNGHYATVNAPGAPEIHNSAGTYVESVFTVASNAGFRTGVYAGKSKFDIFSRSYPGELDEYVYLYDTDDLVDRFIADMQSNPVHLSLLHFRDPDTMGHQAGWDLTPSSAYMQTLRDVDRMLGLVMDAIDSTPDLAGTTALILTTDHGGHDFGHGDDIPDDFQIPFYAWGPGVTAGADLYAVSAASRTQPGSINPPFGTVLPPVRNSDAANLSVNFLGLPDIPGSVINTNYKLRVNSSGPSATTETWHFQDGVFPLSGYAGTRDTKLRSDNASTAFGSDPELEVDGSPAYGVLLGWDLSSLPPGSQVVSASVTLSVFDPSSDSYHLYEMLRPWSEAEATFAVASEGIPWSEAGAAGALDRSPTVLATAAQPQVGTRTIDLGPEGLAVIQRWIEDPSSNQGFALQNYENANDGFDVHSSEAADAADRPRLTLEVVVGQGAPMAVIDAASTALIGESVVLDGSESQGEGSIVSHLWNFGDGITASGPVVTHTWTSEGTYNVLLTVVDDESRRSSSVHELVVTDPAGPVTVAFQNNVSPFAGYSGGRDTKIRSEEPDENFGSHTEMEVDGNPLQSALVAWDLSSIPILTPVYGATIQLSVFDRSVDTYQVRRLLRPWAEAEATHEEFAAGHRWHGAGSTGSGDRGPAVATVTPSRTGLVEIELGPEGLAVVQSWIDNPFSNHGFVLQNTGADDGFDFYSGEATPVSRRPALILQMGASTGIPVAAFTAPATVNPDEVVFLDAAGSSDSDGSIVRYSWDFGDGTLGAGRQTTHRYALPGDYRITLTVEDDAGFTASTGASIRVTDPNPATVATWQFQDGVWPSPGYAGSRDTKLRGDAPDTAFGGESDLEVDGSPSYGALLAWDLSALPPGSSVSSASVTLSVFDPSGDDYHLYEMLRPWSETEATFGQASSGNQWHEPGAAGALDRGNTALATAAQPQVGTRTLDLGPEGLAVVQGWINDPSSNFGFALQNYDTANDGFDLHSREASEPTERPRLTLEVAVVPGGPTASITAAPTAVVGEGIPLDGSLSQGSTAIVSHIWDFGDDTSGNGAAVTHAWAVAGTYHITLTVRDAEGRESAALHELVVSELAAPVAAFTAPVVAVPDEDVVFDASESTDSDGSIVAYTWDFGDGTEGAGRQTIHRYALPGDYTVTLTVEDDAGFTASTGASIQVTDPNPPAVTSWQFQDGVWPSPGYAGSRDTKLRGDAPDTAFGSEPDLEVDGSPSYAALLSWDLSSVTPGATVRGASVTLSVFDPSSDAYHLYEVLRTWSESEATFNEASSGDDWQGPGADGSLDRGSEVLGTAAQPQTGKRTLELGPEGLAVIQRWIDDPSSNHGFALQNFQSANDGFDFHSREASNPSDRPRLTLEIGSGPPPPPGESPVTSRFRRRQWPDANYDGARDTKLRGDAPDTSFGTANDLEVDGSPEYTALLAWNLDGIPAGARVTRAELDISVFDPSGDTYHLYEALRPWSEPEATFRRASATAPWQEEGASGSQDRGSEVLGRLESPDVGNLTVQLNAAGIEAIQRWVDDPVSNHGLVVQNYEASDGFDFHSAEASDAGLRPALRVTWIPPIAGRGGSSLAITAGVLGDEEVPMAIEIQSIYPNPFTSTTTMRLGVEAGGRYRLTVFNSIGQVIQSHSLDSGSGGIREIRVDLEGQASGVYFVALADLVRGTLVQDKMLLVR